MTELLPFDLKGVLHGEIERNRRPPDAKLHASSHLVGSLRHAQLDVVNAPRIPRDFAEDTKLLIGTMLHQWIAGALMRRGIMVMQEVKLDPWLPDGWTGTADGVFYHPDYRAFILGDYKSMRPDALPYVLQRGAKLEHQWQTTMYWEALVNAGLPMVDKIGVVYLPKDQSADRSTPVDLTLVEFSPVDTVLLQTTAAYRAERVAEYKASLFPNDTSGIPIDTMIVGGVQWPVETYLTDALEPVQERVQKLVWDNARARWDLKLVPHWSAAYCPYPHELCNCSTQTTNKIGHWELKDGALVYSESSRGEYKDNGIEPTEQPEVAEVRRRKKRIEEVADGNRSNDADEEGGKPSDPADA